MVQPPYTYITWTLATLWLVLVSLLMWQLFASNYRAFLHENAPTIQNMPKIATGQLTLVHYLDDQCGCNRFAQPHAKDIEASYIDIQHVYPSKVKRADIKSESREINDTIEARLSDWGISSPAVSIIAPDGSLIYHGPYTAGSVCGEGDDLVFAHLKKWDEGDRNQYLNVLGQGCFCPWSSQTYYLKPPNFPSESIS